MTESEIFDEVVARLGESATIQEFRYAVAPFAKTIISSPLFPNAKKSRFNDVTYYMWNEYWHEQYW